MIALIVLAVVGATLGAFMRPRPMALVLALGLAGGLRAGMAFVAHLGEQRLDHPDWAQYLSIYMASPGAGYLPLMAAAGGGSLFAGLLCYLLPDGSTRAFWLPAEGDVRVPDRTGRYKRADDMVRERSAPTEHEQRMRDALGR
jgi:hypothetical protein